MAREKGIWVFRKGTKSKVKCIRLSCRSFLLCKRYLSGDSLRYRDSSQIVVLGSIKKMPIPRCPPQIYWNWSSEGGRTPKPQMLEALWGGGFLTHAKVPRISVLWMNSWPLGPERTWFAEPTAGLVSKGNQLPWGKGTHLILLGLTGETKGIYEHQWFQTISLTDIL